MSLLFVLFLAASVSVLCVTFFDQLPGLRRTPIASCCRLIWKPIIHILSQFDHHVTRGRAARLRSELCQELVMKKHPIFLVLYLCLLSGGAILFVPVTWPLIPWYHKLILLFLLPLPYTFTFICNKSGSLVPHRITARSHAQHLSSYPYDFKLFHPYMQCSTCKLLKPARSKHCSRCHMCVARADHHCIWVNNCIGWGNYKYFLALLLSLAVLLGYTVLLTYVTVMPDMKSLHTRYRQTADNQNLPFFGRMQDVAECDSVARLLGQVGFWHSILSEALLVGGVSRTGVGLLAVIFVPLPAGFLAYHLYLIGQGMTTIEYSRWTDWAGEVADGTVYFAPVLSSYEKSKSEQYLGSKEKAWPKRSGQFLVLTNDGHPPRNLQPEVRAVVGNHPMWQKCRNLDEVDNTYNIGIWRNLKDLMFN